MHKFKNFLISFLYVLLLSYIFIINNYINKYSYFLKQKFEIAIFVKKYTKNLDVIEEKIRNLDNLKYIKFISKEQIKRKLINFENEIFLISTNPFPDTFSIVPESYEIEKIEELIKQIKNIDSIDDIEYDKNTLNIIDGLKTFAKFSKNVVRINILLVIILFIGYIFKLIKFPIKILDLSPDFAFSITGVIIGIICSKLLSLIIYQTTTDFISIGQLVLVIFSGIILSFATS